MKKTIKVSELIQQLSTLKEQYGDIDVVSRKKDGDINETPNVHFEDFDTEEYDEDYDRMKCVMIE